MQGKGTVFFIVGKTLALNWWFFTSFVFSSIRKANIERKIKKGFNPKFISFQRSQLDTIKPGKMS